MRIQSIGNYSVYNNKQQLNSSKKDKPLSFGSICADSNQYNMDDYALYTLIFHDFKKIKCSSTMIFRELSSELAISKLLNPEEKSEIKILGSADGSEAWAYAIMIKEKMGEKSKNVNIKGIDIAPYMTDLSNTGHLVLSSIEKKYANEGLISYDKSPLKGGGWDKYLTKTKRPIQFNDILSKYPCTRYIEHDPVVHKSIGKGLDWYEINKEGLPDVKFECADMRTSITPSKNTDNQVYVIANSAAYLLDKNPSDYIKLFEDIKKQNKDKKNVYVVVGSLENKILYFSTLGVCMKMQISDLGFSNVLAADLDKLGIKGSKEAASKIYKLQ